MLELIRYDDNLPINLRVMEIRHYPWHTHKDIQIIYVMEGEIELKMTYSRYRLGKNNIHFIHSDDVHGVKSLSKNNLIIILSFNMEFFIDYYPNLDTQIFSTKVSEDIATYKKQLSIQALIFSILSELNKKEIGYKDRIKKFSFDLINVLYKDFRSFTVNLEQRTFEHQISYDTLQVDRISRIISYVYENYPYKLGLAELAEQENINNYYLSHLFQKIVGYSFRNFVSMVRIEMSEFELLTTVTPISRIAQNVGFSNAKYYIQNFQEWFGCHPQEYRKLYSREILGNAAAKFKELPLHSINEVLETHVKRSAFANTAPQIKTASLDCKKAETKLLPFSKYGISGNKIYSGYEAHKDCIDLLKKYLSNPFTEPEPPMFYDTDSYNHGLYTFNGLRKPLFWAYRFIYAQYNRVAQYDDWYIITISDEKMRIIVLNENNKSNQDFRFSLLQLHGNYQITQYHLKPDKSCFNYWQQLNFKDSLSDLEIQQINHMSEPEISFLNTFLQDGFDCSLTLEPQEIVLIDIQNFNASHK